MADFYSELRARFEAGDTDRQIAARRVAVSTLRTGEQSIGVINGFTMGRPCPVPNTPLAQRSAAQTRDPLPGLTADTDADLGAFQLAAQ